MNIENILKLADAIEKVPHVKPDRDHWDDTPTPPPTAFHMDEWHCGTVACIGGWANYLFGGCTVMEAANALGLPVSVSRDLFFYSYPIPFEDLTPQMAAWCLRNLAKTGRVDWDATARRFGVGPYALV